MTLKIMSFCLMISLTNFGSAFAGSKKFPSSFNELKNSGANSIITRVNFEQIYYKNNNYEREPVCFNEVLMRNSLKKIDPKAPHLNMNLSVIPRVIITESGPIDQIKSGYINEIPDAEGFVGVVNLILQYENRYYKTTCLSAGAESAAEAEAMVLETLREIFSFKN